LDSNSNQEISLTGCCNLSCKNIATNFRIMNLQFYSSREFEIIKEELIFTFF
jgi:hypothetical protein